MRIKLRPDKDLRVKKIRIGRVPTLVLQPANQADYTMLMDDELSREAIKRFERRFEDALERYC